MEGALPSGPDERRRLVFRLGDDHYAIDATRVLEVIQTPGVTRVPLAFDALAGIANLRGAPLPVIDVAKILEKACERGAGRRVIVYDHGEPLGLLVDDVVTFGALEEDDRHRAIDIEDLLRAATLSTRPARPTRVRAAGAVAQSAALTVAEQVHTVLTFRAAGQIFGLPLGSIHEILAWPADIDAMEGDRTLLGVTASRDRTLPVFSLAALLDLPGKGSPGGRIVVLDHGGHRVGLAVERIDTIRRLPDGAIDPVPPVLAHTGESPAEIAAIGRIDGGRTLVSLLSAQKLFGKDVVEQAINTSDGDTAMPDSADDTAFERFLIFTLGEESYGLPIGAVEEVIRLPDSITRLPQAPAFVAGIINLRGKALPLIDQRQRFETTASVGAAGHGPGASRPRAIVVTVDQLRAGFIVDGVADVVAIPLTALSPAPELADAAVFDRVAPIEAAGRMILLVDPRELLTQAERDVVAALTDPSASATDP